jgi:site-specific DNA-methyltransferase (adenine-specific)
VAVTVLTVGDSLTVMRTMADQSVDAIVTDPPYHLTSIVKRFGSPTAAPAKSNGATGVYARSSGGFMGQQWDGGDIAFRTEVWEECLRVLKPGGHLLAFGGSRTYHRLACAVEDAGFEIRDQIMWVYGSGFPKSLDVSKAIDKMHGADPQVIGFKDPHDSRTAMARSIYGSQLQEGAGQGHAVTMPTTDDARRWQGWGTALKPAHEPIVLARRPLDGTVAETVLAHGTGALNIEGCRIPSEHRIDISANKPSGRWPANFIHDGSDEVLELFPEERQSGSAARFFYCAKASRAEREAGLDDFNPRRESDRIADDLPGGDNPRNRTNAARRNHHPTVKPIALMRYLIRLVTPPGAVVLDPFAGSGTTGIAAALEGCEFVGIEQSADYAAIAEARIAAQGKLT